MAMKKSTISWIEFAKRDLQGAKELSKNEYLANLVIFHSQQCVEKFFKAVLEEHSIHIPKIHNLKKLYSMFPDQVIEQVSIDLDELDMMDQIYIDSRYPADFGLLPSGIPTQKDADLIYQIAEDICKSIFKLLDV